MKRALSVPVLVGLCLSVFLLSGCEPLTPEAKAKIAALNAKADALQATVLDLDAKLRGAVARYENLKGEYEALVAAAKAGKPVDPATLASLGSQLAGAAGEVAAIYGKSQEALKQVKEVFKAREEVAAAGVPWYDQVPWGAILGLLGGAAGVYFPAARPAIEAARRVASTYRDYVPPADVVAADKEIADRLGAAGKAHLSWEATPD